jgi:CRISPR-associated protein Cas5t
MKYIIVEIKTQTATFRNPEFQNFHKSFSLPPPTTLIGLAGAALGLSPNAAQNFFTNDSKFGVYGTSQGFTKDLWKYNTFDAQGSIILKEIYIHNHYFLIYELSEAEKLQRLFDAFENPAFALTLGNSDSIAKIMSVTSGESYTTSNTIEKCLVEGDIVNEVLKNSGNGLNFSIHTFSEPVAYDVPTRFTYESEYGFRQVARRTKLSFIERKMVLNISISGVEYENKFIPLFSLNDTD